MHEENEAKWDEEEDEEEWKEEDGEMKNKYCHFSL
jgi:hypothetical protein